MLTIVDSKFANEADLITHGGIFHADEVMATAILLQLMPSAKLCRLNKLTDNISKNAIVYDIGGGKFDHHQKGGNGFRKNGVPYSSAGLIWREYSYLICGKLASKVVDKALIQGIDATDNGVMPRCDYPVQPMSISSVISGFNPTWDSIIDSDIAFLEAVKFAEVILKNSILSALAEEKSKSIISQTVNEADSYLIILEKFISWQKAIFELGDMASDILYVAFPSKRGGYNVQAVPKFLGSFEPKKPFPKEWRGEDPNTLSLITGIDDVTFCHPNGFIAGAKTLEGIKSLAKKAFEA